MKRNYKYSDVTFIIPSRENLHFLKYAYKSIRTNIGPEPFILCADDYSILDNTKEWLIEIKKIDPNFDFILNEGPERKGHVILFNELISNVKTELFILAHADMVWLKGSLDGLLKYMSPKKVVSATRCEPNIHPKEQCKVSLPNLPDDPSKLNEDELYNYVKNKYIDKNVPISKGIFAPYLMETEEYLSIGGCDPLFRPTSREDDDLWNRLLFNGCEFIQSWESFVYHRSCAGSRWNPSLTEIGQNSKEWDEQQPKSLRNYYRKWKTIIYHDEWHYPNIAPVYNIHISLVNSTVKLLHLLEPFADILYTDISDEKIVEYINLEQSNTDYKLDLKILKLDLHEDNKDGINVYIDGDNFNEIDYQNLMLLTRIINNEKSTGTFKIGNLKITIHSLNEYQKLLIKNQ